MTNNEQSGKLAASGTVDTKMLLSMRAKEDVIVFHEEPKLSAGETFEQRKDAHELFSLFTANIIKKNVLFIR